MKNIRLSVLAIVGVNVKTLIADDKYSLGNRKNLQHSISSNEIQFKFNF